LIEACPEGGPLKENGLFKPFSFIIFCNV
jgi:hypothetical protein